MLQRKTPGQKVERLRRRDNAGFADLRRKAKRWAGDNLAALTDPDPSIPEPLNDRAADNRRPLLAIADLAGGEWPERAREAACLLAGESRDDTIGVKLLEDIQKAYGEADAMRSVDIAAELAKDPERPWADWKHGRPLSANQLGRLLSKFGITSETVDIPGLKSAKGYRRVRFEAAWEAYCPGQNPLPAQNGFSKGRTVETPVESAQVGVLQKVEEGLSDLSENGNLSYSHAGFDVSTFSKGESGGVYGSDQDLTPAVASEQQGNGHAVEAGRSSDDLPDLPRTWTGPRATARTPGARLTLIVAPLSAPKATAEGCRASTAAPLRPLGEGGRH
jgi:hypothetical protein